MVGTVLTTYDIEPLDTVYNINAQKYLDLSSISRVVKIDYEKEYEIRIIAVLFSNMLVPEKLIGGSIEITLPF